jgi:hypothetical protein
VRAQADEPAIEDIDDDDPSDEQAIAELETQEADDEQPAAQTAGPEPILRSIAPSPAAWRAAAAAAEEERSLASETPQASGARSTDARSAPPAPPVGWWSPTNRGFDAG